jgi:hypothetical protein
MLELKAHSNCWVCEGWTEFRFDFNPPNPEEIDQATTPIMLHVSCDKYQGELLDRDSSGGDQLCYSTTRMLPPGTLTYYYSVNSAAALQQT